MRKALIWSFAVLATLSLSTVVSADTLAVYVGYADNLRPSGFFPNVWLGDSNVVSQTPPGESLDSGAIRIDNNGPSAVTISNMTVTLNGVQPFAIWSPLTIDSGQTGIFTQTTSYNFDTSDYGLFGGLPVNVDSTHPLGGCTNPANASQVASCMAYQPVVSFNTLNGVVTYTDSGHVLDTFGYDLINLPAPGGDGNESINWSLIGTEATRNGDLAPEPSSLLLLGGGLLALVFARRKRSL